MTENPQFDKIKEFNQTFGHAVRETPSLDHDDLPLRLGIFLEEVEEVVSNYLDYLDSKAHASSNTKDQRAYNDLLISASQRVRDFNDLISFKLYCRKKHRGYQILDYAVRQEYAGDAEDQRLEVLDGLADTLVTLYGFAQGSGMPITEALDIVHNSNMSKTGADGKPVYFTEGEKAGKIAKGPHYWEPKAKLAELLHDKGV